MYPGKLENEASKQTRKRSSQNSLKNKALKLENEALENEALLW